jgi:hypothetical protein
MKIAFQALFEVTAYSLYLSGIPGAIMLDKEDFSRFSLPTSWYYLFP